MPRCVIDVLGKMDELAWHECSPTSANEISMVYPPYIIWRFKIENELRDQKIKDAVTGFLGLTKWDIDFNGRNWSITVKSLDEFFCHKKYINFYKARRDFASTYPEIGRIANQECYLLAEALDRNR
jgi:hypothetical protein